MQGDDWRKAKEGPNHSWVWRSILKTLPLLVCGACFLVGNGEDIRVWDDPWVPSMANFIPSPATPAAPLESLKVKDLLADVSGQWNRQKVINSFDLESAEAILRIKVPEVT